MWRLVTRADKPLAGKKKLPRASTSAEKPPPAPKTKPALRSYESAANRLMQSGSGTAVARKAKPSQGNMSALDAKNARRFKRGKMEIDARLDLHGLTSEKAHKQVHAFLQKHHAKGSRCLLVITGKGKRFTPEEPARPGVLQGLLPSWLGHDDIAPMILAFDHAPPALGGQGAWLILLKRKR